ncbi:hypothetical protein EI555_009973, partial [Monodon monoceros]
TTVNVFGPEFQRLISTPPTESPAQGEPRPEIRVAPGQILRVSCLLRPGQGGGAAAGWGGPLRPAAPGHSAPLGSAAWAPGRGGARSPPGPETTRTRRSGRPLGPGAPHRGPAAAASREPPPRVHTSPHRQASGSREPRCPPGVAGPGRKPSAPAPLAWDSPAPWPRSPRSGCDFTRVPSEEGKRAGWRRLLAPGPSAAHQETGSCSPRRCPSRCEYPGEGGPRSPNWTSRDRLSGEIPDRSERERGRDLPARSGLGRARPCPPGRLPPQSPRTPLNPLCSPAPDWFFWFSLPPWDALGDPMTSLADGDFPGERPPLLLRGSPSPAWARAAASRPPPAPVTRRRPGADSRPRGSRPGGWRPAGGGLEVRGWRGGERGAAERCLSPPEEGLHRNIFGDCGTSLGQVVSWTLKLPGARSNLEGLPAS